MFWVYPGYGAFKVEQPQLTRKRKRNKMTKLETKYGKRTANIVGDILAGLPVKKIAAKRHVKLSTVRTTMGNFTRGSYDRLIG